MNTSKNISSSLFISLMLAILFISCTNDIANAPDIDNKDVKLNSIEDLNLVVDNLNNVTSYGDLKKIHQNTSKVEKRKNSELEKVLQPLINEGKEFKNSLKENSDKKRFKNGISDLNKKQTMLLGLVSLIHNELKKNNNSLKNKTISNVDGDKVVSCASAALGVQSVKTIISGTAELMTAKTAVKIVKTVGKRYLGYVGVAIAVYEFTNCISE
ncbi:hypothetical protein [Fodinibius halophilus]|uniref:Uncharacterized protein n=1 Tax=Fodinibius halophilus TaxID=1736908 RepID=A0A6M1TC30_9BACT|nr:hypothetical protein [Fodinibius halophilus]NGP88484.1 hypothetical protein [Fodinibius halophilus]